MQNEKALRWAINIAALVVLMDLSAVNIALPIMRTFFQTNVATVSLLLMVSMLTATSSALVLGKISQRHSPKRILIIGFVIFGTTTFLSGILQDFNFLLILRFVQGFAEASLYVVGPAVIKHFLPAEKQAKAYGQWMMSTGIGISVGPLIGGYLISVFSWPAVFFINIPFVLLGLYFSSKVKLITPILKKEKFDFLGAFYSFVFLAFLILGVNIIRLEDIGFGISLITLSIIFFILFICRERKYPIPILELGLFRNRNFGLASLGFFIFFVVNVGSRFIRPFYFEEVRGFSSDLSGLLMIVSPAIMVLLSPFTEPIQRYFGTRLTIVWGNLLLFISMILFSFWGASTSLYFIVVSMGVLGVGMGLFYPAATFIGMSSLKAKHYGMGSAAISTSKSMGKLIGVLIFAMVFTAYLQKTSSILESGLVQDRLSAIQYVFRMAAIVSFFGLLFSFFFQKND